MKSIARLLSVAALVATLGFANVSQAGTMAGAKLGVGINSLSNAAGSRTSIVGGLFLDAEVAPMFHIQPEILYNDAYAGLNYLDVPLLLKVKFDVSPGFKPYLAVGPQLGIRLSGTGFQTINFAIPIAGGLEYEASPGLSLVLDVRYVLGLSNTVANATPALNTRYFQITAGVGFAI